MDVQLYVHLDIQLDVFGTIFRCVSDVFRPISGRLSDGFRTIFGRLSDNCRTFSDVLLPLFEELKKTSRETSELESDSNVSWDVSLNGSKSGVSIFWCSSGSVEYCFHFRERRRFVEVINSTVSHRAYHALSLKEHLGHACCTKVRRGPSGGQSGSN